MKDYAWSAIMILILAVCSIWRMHPQKEMNALSITESVNIKGVAACMIVCSHIFLVVGKFQIFSVIAFLFTGIFFFYSGYGITCGLRKRTNKKEKVRYLADHVVKLLIMYVITEIVYYVAYLAFSQIEFSLLNMLQCITGWNLLASHMWFVLALCVIYVVMMFGSLIVPKLNYEILSLVGILIYILWQLVTGADYYRLQSCIAFPVGVAFAVYPGLYKKIVRGRYLKRWPGIFANLGAFLAAFLSVYLLRHFVGDFYLVRVLLGWASVVSFLILILKILDGWELDNRFLRITGGHSTEIYTAHLLVLLVLNWLFQGWIGKQSPVLIFFIVMVLTLLVAEIQGYIVSKIKRVK